LRLRTLLSRTLFSQTLVSQTLVSQTLRRPNLFPPNLFPPTLFPPHGVPDNQCPRRSRGRDPMSRNNAFPMPIGVQWRQTQRGPRQGLPTPAASPVGGARRAGKAGRGDGPPDCR